MDGIQMAPPPPRKRRLSRSKLKRLGANSNARYRSDVPESDQLPHVPLRSVSYEELGNYFGDSSSASSSEIEDVMIDKDRSTDRRRSNDKNGDEEPKEEFWTESSRFKKISAAIIFINTMVIIVETCFIQLQLVVFDYIELAFTMSYVCELLLCFQEQGIRRFLCTDDVWNKFDFLVTVLSVSDLLVDKFIASNAEGQSFSAASFGRLFRLIRILRVIRGLRFLNELDYVLIQVTRATLRLGLVVGMVLLVSGIIVTQMLWDCSDDYVAALFSDLGNSLWTLFRIMTLDNWAKIVEHVIQAKPEMKPFFTFFIFTTAISLISLAPAMFIDISLKKTQRDEKSAQMRARAKARNQKRRLLLTLFKTADIDENGLISVDEMKNVLTNHAILNELEARGITKAQDLRDVRLGLFDLWEETITTDQLEDTEFTMEQFVAGVLKEQEDITQEVLWRSCTSTRLMLHDFAAIVLDDLNEIREVLLHGYQHSSSFGFGASGSSMASPGHQAMSSALNSSVKRLRDTKVAAHAHDKDKPFASWSEIRRSGISVASKISAGSGSGDRESDKAWEKTSNGLESGHERESTSRSWPSQGCASDQLESTNSRQITPPAEPGPRSRPAVFYPRDVQLMANQPHVTFSGVRTSATGSSDRVGELRPMKGVKPFLLQGDEDSQALTISNRNTAKGLSHLLAARAKKADERTNSNSTVETPGNSTVEEPIRPAAFDARFGDNPGRARQLVGTTIFRV